MAFIKFLGTAGGRFVVAKQLRSSAGVFISHQGTSLILDPGPGTLSRCARARPSIDVLKLDGLILSHGHLDHANDANILLDAMNQGGLKKAGTLFCPRDCLEGNDPIILRYLRANLERIEILSPDRDYQLGSIRFRTSVRHHHPVETYGIIFDFSGKKIGFLVDTAYFEGLASSYRGVDILVINLVRYHPPRGYRLEHLHMTDAKRLIEEISPQRVILTHFGMTMLRAKPDKVAEELSWDCAIPVTAARDGFHFEL
ncbi:MBL fold metallo-hydrolase [Thermosulfuriphilus sp.]